MTKKASSKPSRSAVYYDALTAKIVAAMETDPTGWTKPWVDMGGLPRNAVTGKRYNGSNVFWLAAAADEAGFTTPNWATYKMWASIGAHVVKGSKSTVGIFWKIIKKKEDGKEVTIPFMKTFNLFNLDEVLPREEDFVNRDGTITPKATEAERAYLESLRTPVVLTETERDAAADEFFAAVGADVSYGGDRAFYSPGTDSIRLPEPDRFESTEAFYSVKAHEHTHWTGAKHRLNRDHSGRFGDESYAVEELIAELGAAFICSHLGISAEPRPDHAKYMVSWLKAIADNDRVVYRAAADAAKACDFMIALAEADLEVEVAA